MELVTSELAVREARRNLEAKCPEKLPVFERLVGPLAIQAQTGASHVLPTEVKLPEKDRAILSAAVEGGATHFLTGDKAHFHACFGQKVLGVLVLLPRDYLRPRAGPAG